MGIREFPLPRHDFADYLLYVEGCAAGVIEAKKEGAMLSGVEILWPELRRFGQLLADRPDTK